MVDIGDWKTFQAVCTRPKSVYRGQTAYYPKILPSLFRGPLPANYNGLGSAAAALYLQAYRAEERHAQIMQEEGAPLELYDDELGPYGTPPSPFSGHGFGSIGQYDEYGPMISNFLGSDEGYRHAVLQHYGAPTPALDVTFDARIALWFASHEFRCEPNGLARYYRRTQPGIVYVMSAPNHQLIDLRGGRLIPAAGLRGQRQAGGLLLGATAGHPDLSIHVVETLKVLPDVLNDANENLAHLTQRFLFPPPDDDPFFDALIDARLSPDLAQRELAKWFTVYV